MKHLKEYVWLYVAALVAAAGILFFTVPSLRNMLPHKEEAIGARYSAPSSMTFAPSAYAPFRDYIEEDGVFEATPDNAFIHTNFPLAKKVGENVWYEVLGIWVKDRGVMLVRDLGTDATLLVEDEMYRELELVGTAGIIMLRQGDIIRVGHVIANEGSKEPPKSAASMSFYHAGQSPEISDVKQAVGSEKYPITKDPQRIYLDLPSREPLKPYSNGSFEPTK